MPRSSFASLTVRLKPAILGRPWCLESLTNGSITIVARARRIVRPQISPELASRLPPGQVLTRRWPVLHFGDVPAFDAATWDFQLTGCVEKQLRLTWPEFQALPTIEVAGDLHCVTRWSKLDNRWTGVAPRELLERAVPAGDALFVIVHCDGGYTANLPISALMDDDVVFATAHDGTPLSAEHGFPVRLMIPSRYAWKSAKWVRNIELVQADRPGFWESYGYNSSADPWLEERFASEETEEH